LADPVVLSWSAERVERFTDEASALARGFRRTGATPDAPEPLPEKSHRRHEMGKEAGLGLRRRLDEINWDAAAKELRLGGQFFIPRLLSGLECAQILEDSSDPDRFARSVNMAPRGFGIGSYHYFKEPLPEPATTLRLELYRRLQPLANAHYPEHPTYPPSLRDFWRQCRSSGQKRSSSILLCYGNGGVNHPHRDIYGKEFFPFQALVVLNERGKDFEGGEFLLMDDEPGGTWREIPVSEGDLVLFATRDRWQEGGGRRKKIALRHGMKLVRRGKRYALGIVFHLAE
jgi:hypothetical protein